MATRSLPYHCPKCGRIKEFQSLLKLREHLMNDHTFSDFLDASPQHRAEIHEKRLFQNFLSSPSSEPIYKYPPDIPLLSTGNYVPNLLRKLSNVADDLQQQLLLAQDLTRKRTSYASNLKKQCIGVRQFDLGYPQSIFEKLSQKLYIPEDQSSDGSNKLTMFQKNRQKSPPVEIQLGEQWNGDDADAESLSVTLRRVQDELVVKERELESSKEELAKVKQEKVQLNENSIILVHELDATKGEVLHLKSEIEDKERLIQQKERSLKEVNDFLEETSEKQTAAKEQLKVFMDSILDRAEQAENDLHALTSMRSTPVGSMRMQPFESVAVNGSASLTMNDGSGTRPHELVSSLSSNELPPVSNQPLNATSERQPSYERLKNQRKSSGRRPMDGRTSATLGRTSESTVTNGRNSSHKFPIKKSYSVPYQRESSKNPLPFYHTLERPDSPASPRSHLTCSPEQIRERNRDLYSDSAIGSSGNGSRITNSEFAISQMSPQALPQLLNSVPELSITNGRHDEAIPANQMKSKRHAPIHETVVESTTNDLQSVPQYETSPASADDYVRASPDGRGHHLPITRNHLDETREVQSVRNGTEDYLDLELFRSAVEDIMHQRDIQSRTSLYSPIGGGSQQLYTELQSQRTDSISEGQSSGYDDVYGDGSLDELPVKDQSSGFKDCPKQRKIALFCVFSYLETESLLTCAQVCKEWGQVSRHPELWKKVHLSRRTISSKFLQNISKLCTQTEHLTLESLRPRAIRKGERRHDYIRKTRGTLEAGLEYILQTSGSSLLTLRIYDCCNILTDRSLWLASCHCRFLETIMYVSNTDPIGHEVIWALGAGCRNIRALQIPPMFPCENAQKFNNKCVQMIGRCWPLLQGLCVGGIEIDVRGLVSVVKNCPRLYVLELDHMLEVTEETAIAMCSHGLRGLESLIFTATPVTPKAILHFNSACPQLKVLAVYVGISDYFDDITNRENQREYKSIASKLKKLKKMPALMNILHLKTNCN